MHHNSNIISNALLQDRASQCTAVRYTSSTSCPARQYGVSPRHQKILTVQTYHNNLLLQHRVTIGVPRYYSAVHSSNESERCQSSPSKDVDCTNVSKQASSSRPCHHCAKVLCRTPQQQWVRTHLQDRADHMLSVLSIKRFAKGTVKRFPIILTKSKPFICEEQFSPKGNL